MTKTIAQRPNRLARTLAMLDRVPTPLRQPLQRRRRQRLAPRPPARPRPSW